MVQPLTPYVEIVVRVMPARLGMEEQRSRRGQEPAQTYDVLIYSDLEIFRYREPPAPPLNEPMERAGLPLAAVERIDLRWSRYQEYLAQFVEGARDPYKMRYQLFQTMSTGLEVLFDAPLADQPVRIWWANETPELEDLPWELLLYTQSRAGSGANISLLRGLPPEDPMPDLPIPVEGPLRLGLIHHPEALPPPLRALMESPPAGIEVVPLTGPPLEALAQAAREGYELLHIVAHGIVSSAYEGILRLTDEAGRSHLVSPGQLDALLRGGRVAALALTPPLGPETMPPYEAPPTSERVPTTYRAYAYLGRARLSLPCLLVPLGPLLDVQIWEFYRAFYEALAEAWDIEEAMVRGRTAVASTGVPAAMALYLRRHSGRLFTRMPSQRPDVSSTPAQAQATLEIYKDFNKRLEKLVSSRGGLESLRPFLEESAHQKKLTDDLQAWTEAEEDQS